MKIFLFFFTFLILQNFSFSQSSRIDSLRDLLKKEKTDTVKADILWQLSGTYGINSPDSLLQTAQQGLFLSRRSKYVRGEMQALKQMAEAYEYFSNYPMALKYYFQRLELDEKIKDPERQAVTLLSIANLYQLQEDYKHAIEYAKRGNRLIEEEKLNDYKWYGLMVFGEMYEKMNKIEEAVKYNKEAYAFAKAKKDSAWIGMCLNNSANTFLKAGLVREAEAYYNQGISYLTATKNYSFLCESYQGLAKIKLQQGRLDSALFYAKESFNIGKERKFEKVSTSCELLTQIFKASNRADSALAYQIQFLSIEDSILNADKVRQVQSLTIVEELRQKEIEEEKALEQKERKHKLQLLLVGLLIPMFFFLTVLLSRRKISGKIVEVLGIISLPIFFEYLTLWLHPFIANLTNHTPLYAILILVALAAFLTPGHHRIEHWLLHLSTAHLHSKKDKIIEHNEPVKELRSSKRKGLM